jgi:putative FmdB family regulatory protein
MPLYEYECDACGHRFEKIQKFSDPLENTCPKCGGPVHKLMSSPAIQFKGSGWYITDYAKKDSTPAKDAKAGAADAKDAKTPSDEAKDTKAGSSDTKDTKSASANSKDGKAAADTKPATKPAP